MAGFLLVNFAWPPYKFSLKTEPNLRAQTIEEELVLAADGVIEYQFILGDGYQPRYPSKDNLPLTMYKSDGIDSNQLIGQTVGIFIIFAIAFGWCFPRPRPTKLKKKNKEQ